MSTFIEAVHPSDFLFLWRHQITNESLEFLYLWWVWCFRELVGRLWRLWKFCFWVNMSGNLVTARTRTNYRPYSVHKAWETCVCSELLAWLQALRFKLDFFYICTQCPIVSKFLFLKHLLLKKIVMQSKRFLVFRSHTGSTRWHSSFFKIKNSILKKKKKAINVSGHEAPPAWLACPLQWRLKKFFEMNFTLF